VRSIWAGIILCLLLAVSVQTVYAVPITVPATGLSSQNITFHVSDATDPAWWEYGVVPGNLVWRTDNQSVASDGTANVTETGTPLMSLTTYYYRACDSTGCGAEHSSTLLAVTPAPETTFGRVAHNISVSHFDLALIGGSILEPYTWVTANANVALGVLLVMIFCGIWLRQREVILPIMLGMIGAALLIFVPPEFMIIAVAFVCAGLAGVLLGLIKR
jgi:hypothetical protein